MNYTFSQLRTFIKIAETGSVTRAAEELHLSQPAVSVQLRNFQRNFDRPVTEVIGRQLYVTDFGREVVDMAQEILDRAEVLNGRLQQESGTLNGTLKLSVVSTAKYVIPFFLTGFLHENPGVQLRMDVTNKAKVVASLENNEVDFSLVSVLPKLLSIQQLDLLKNKLYLVGNRDREFKHPPYDRTIFADLPLIYREHGSATRQTMEQFIEMNDISVKKKLQLTSNEAVKQAVIAGLGYSIMPLIGIHNELEMKQLQIIPVHGLPIITQWSLIWPGGKRHSPTALAFREYLRQNRERVVEERFGWVE
ncbi:MAG: LysR family transcriptional regulator [Saprospiraceae bacterium]